MFLSYPEVLLVLKIHTKLLVCTLQIKRPSDQLAAFKFRPTQDCHQDVRRQRPQTLLSIFRPYRQSD